MKEGAKIYNPLVLKLYDLWVLGLSNSFFWKCSTNKLLQLYNDKIGQKHLDIGVGTGWYLDKVTLSQKPCLTLLDLNPNSLSCTERRISRYNPKTILADVLQPLPLTGEKFDSIGLMYVLHCLQGSLRSKSRIFDHLFQHLEEGGRIFGATITGVDFESNFIATKLMEIYNRKGIFENWEDDPKELEFLLKKNFRDVSVEKEGSVAIFSAIK